MFYLSVSTLIYDSSSNRIFYENMQTFDVYVRLRTRGWSAFSRDMVDIPAQGKGKRNKEMQDKPRLPTKWFHSASSAACCAKQPFITLAHMSPHASTLPGIPLQDGQAVILVRAAAQSAVGFSYGQQRVRLEFTCDYDGTLWCKREASRSTRRDSSGIKWNKTRSYIAFCSKYAEMQTV